MKREIKFRAWFPDNHWAFKKGRQMVYDITDNTIFEACGFWDEAVIFEQFTGLYDTDGAEIYEGDIIQVLDNKGVVGWSTKFASFTISGYWWNFKNFFGGDPIDYKVIGNIHENSLKIKN